MHYSYMDLSELKTIILWKASYLTTITYLQVTDRPVFGPGVFAGIYLGAGIQNKFYGMQN